MTVGGDDGSDGGGALLEEAERFVGMLRGQFQTVDCQLRKVREEKRRKEKRVPSGDE